MTEPQGIFAKLSRLAILLSPCLLASAILSSALANVGCRRRARRQARARATLDLSSTQPRGSQSSPLPTPGKLTAEDLLREVLESYVNAKYYADSGYVEFLFEPDAGVSRAPYRIPCSLAAARPNYLRVRLGSSYLRSDGKTLRAEVLSAPYSDVKLERAAPLVISSVKELYPDPIFAEHANLGIPTNLFWTSPQLVLLFAKDPKKTLVPDGAKLKLLSPEYLQIEGMENESPIPCDRLQISAEDGTRVFWITRATRSLVRCELPAERIASPYKDARVSAVRIDFPHQVLSTEPPIDESLFYLDADATKKRVERFYSPELLAQGVSFPKAGLRVCDEPTSFRAQLGNHVDFSASKFTFVYFIDGTTFSSFDDVLFRAFRELAKDPNFSEVRFVATFLGPGGVLSDASASYLETARLDFAALRESGLPPPETPSFLLIDADGVVRKYERTFFSQRRLRALLTTALMGGDAGQEDRIAYYDGSRRFCEFIDAADLRDVYRATTEFSDQISAPNRTYPQTFRLRESWRITEAAAPSNPLVLTNSGAEPGDADAFSLPREGLVTPCDGNALAVISSDGRLVRKTSAFGSRGEPIDFVRSVTNADGRRYFAASAHGRSGKVSRFDDRLNDLGVLDVGVGTDRRVGDLALLSTTGSQAPTLFVGLLNDPQLAASPTHGLYAVDGSDNRIEWRNLSVRFPFCLGVWRSSDGSATLLSTDYGESETSGLTRYTSDTGAPVGRITSPEGGSIRQFAVSQRSRESGAVIGALVLNATGRESFVGFSSDGAALWSNPTPTYPNGGLERVQPFDLDEDGYDEWIVASPDGTVQFFDDDGHPIDLFQYGSELTGMSAARWSTGAYLILTDTRSITAWKFEHRSQRKSHNEKQR